MSTVVATSNCSNYLHFLVQNDERVVFIKRFWNYVKNKVTVLILICWNIVLTMDKYISQIFNLWLDETEGLSTVHRINTILGKLRGKVMLPYTVTSSTFCDKPLIQRFEPDGYTLLIN